MEGKNMKSIVSLFFALCGIAFAGPAYKIITPFAPGLNNQVILQAIPELNRITDFDFYQETLPGAGALIATNAFLNSRDPNRLLVATQNTLILQPYFNSEIKYSRSDFKPVALVGENTMCFVVSDRLGVDNFDDFLKVAKTKPLFYGTSTGINSMEHVWFQYLTIKYQLKAEAVHYKGAQEAQLAVVKGDTAMALLPATMCRSEMPSRVIVGYTTTREKKSLPKDLHIVGFMTIVAPKDTSPERVKILSDAFVKVWNDNHDVLNKLVNVPKPILSGPEVEKFIEDMDQKWQNYFKTISSQR
jgi:tripartite-type tricarboxylate transporter receptor subunit TctC